MLIRSGGDILDFEQLMELYQKRVLALALRMTGNVADAQDAAQEVFLRLHSKLDSLPDSAAVLPWLHRVTVNVCIDESRRRRTVPLDGVVVVSTRPDPEQQHILRQSGDRVQAALSRLGQRERAAIVLRDLEGLPTAEVAEVLGTTESTVRVQIAKARLKLRELLKGAML